MTDLTWEFAVHVDLDTLLIALYVELTGGIPALDKSPQLSILFRREFQHRSNDPSSRE
jgi:hypothetical protein